MKYFAFSIPFTWCLAAENGKLSICFFSATSIALVFHAIPMCNRRPFKPQTVQILICLAKKEKGIVGLDPDVILQSATYIGGVCLLVAFRSWAKKSPRMTPMAKDPQVCRASRTKSSSQPRGRNGWSIEIHMYINMCIIYIYTHNTVEMLYVTSNYNNYIPRSASFLNTRI